MNNNTDKFTEIIASANAIAFFVVMTLIIRSIA